jgi:hypothetical protein
VGPSSGGAHARRTAYASGRGRWNWTWGWSSRGRRSPGPALQQCEGPTPASTVASRCPRVPVNALRSVNVPCKPTSTSMWELCSAVIFHENNDERSGAQHHYFLPVASLKPCLVFVSCYPVVDLDPCMKNDYY